MDYTGVMTDYKDAAQVAALHVGIPLREYASIHFPIIYNAGWRGIINVQVYYPAKHKNAVGVGSMRIISKYFQSSPDEEKPLIKATLLDVANPNIYALDTALGMNLFDIRRGPDTSFSSYLQIRDANAMVVGCDLINNLEGKVLKAIT